MFGPSIGLSHLSSIILLATLSIPLQAQIRPDRPKVAEKENLVHKVYTLQEQSMEHVNWVYLGFAPRIEDPKRINITLSKQGFTMRVNFEMTPEEVAGYPNYLERRAKAIDQFRARKDEFGRQRLLFKQEHLYQRFRDQIRNVVSGSNMDFDEGFFFLSSFFPENVEEKSCSFDSSKRCVEGNFVYPITIHRDAMMTLKDGSRITKPMVEATPKAETYFTQTLEERRSAHYEYFESGPLKGHRTGNISDHLFNGLPAFWFKTASGTKGQGIHGPIRFSSSQERQGVVKNDYLDDPENWMNINPLYRFEIVRTANSEGCIRSEPMEMRHLLPTKYSAATQVPILIIDEIDQVDGMYVDVNYYVENHYNKQDKRDWYLKHYITYEEREWAHKMGLSIDQILDQKLARTKVYPYLHPRTVEYWYRNHGNETGASVMTQLNRSPQPN